MRAKKYLRAKKGFTTLYRVFQETTDMFNILIYSKNLKILKWFFVIRYAIEDLTLENTASTLNCEN
jgi:hypothetical protein